MPYPRNYYLTDGINGEIWCVGYIIVDAKYEKKDGKTYKMIHIPKETGSTDMRWKNVGEVK